MRDLLNALAIVALAAGSALANSQTPAGPAAVPQAQEVPPLPTLQGDPADSLYRMARTALQQRDYRRAADLFGQITAKHPGSGYAGDAIYWHAFAPSHFLVFNGMARAIAHRAERGIAPK